MSTHRYLLVDTNILAYQTMALRGGLGPSLLHLAKIRNAKIVFPEALRGELQQHAASIVAESCRNIEREMHLVQLWTGRGRVSRLPDVAAIADGVDNWLEGLREWLHPVPTSSDLVQRAATRVFDKAPPSHTRESFKDSVIWESLMTLPAGANVLFASNDAAAFFDESGEVLHPTLKAEADSHGQIITAFRKLEDLLKELQGEQPPLDVRRAQQVLSAALVDHYAELTRRWGTDGFDVADIEMTPFLTHRPGIVSIQFVSRAKVAGAATVSGRTYLGASTVISGSCDYDPHGGVTSLRVERESLVSADGRELPDVIAYIQTTSPRDIYRHRERLIDRAKQDPESDTSGRGKQKSRKDARR